MTDEETVPDGTVSNQPPDPDAPLIRGGTASVEDASPEEGTDTEPAHSTSAAGGESPASEGTSAPSGEAPEPTDGTVSNQPAEAPTEPQGAPPQGAPDEDGALAAARALVESHGYTVS